MAASSLCRKAAFDLCVPTQIRQNESRCARARGSASCTSNIVPQTQRPKQNLARRITANAETLGVSATYGGSTRRWRVAESLPRRTTRCTRVTASKDGSEVVLEWKGEANTVLLTGSFLNWEKQVPLERAGDGVFKVKYRLPPGAHQYKFLVDGQWQHRPDAETVADGIGGVNNQVVVTENPPAAGGNDAQGADSQPSTPTPDELQAIAVKAPPPGEDPEPIEKTVAKVMGKDGKKEAPKDKDDAKPASKPAAKKVEAEPKPAAKPVAKAGKKVAASAAKEGDNGAPTAGAAPTPKAKPAAKGKAGKKAGKAPAKGLNELMQEDVVPMLSAELEKENVTDVELVWENNELRGCFVNGGVPYCFWAFFPDGKIEGSRGFSLTSHGYPPSTIEPFFDGEKPQTMSADMMVFWIKKRLFAQKSALPKLN